MSPVSERGGKFGVFQLGEKIQPSWLFSLWITAPPAGPVVHINEGYLFLWAQWSFPYLIT